MKQKPLNLTKPNNNDQSKSLKDCKHEKYKIDNEFGILYRVITTYNANQPQIFKTLPLEELDSNSTDFFFTLMKNLKCETFTMYYENNYEIKKIINLIYQQDLQLSHDQLLFLKQFFNNIRNALITLFDMHIKPIINSTTVESRVKGNNHIDYTLPSKPRILN